MKLLISVTTMGADTQRLKVAIGDVAEPLQEAQGLPPWIELKLLQDTRQVDGDAAVEVALQAVRVQSPSRALAAIEGGAIRFNLLFRSDV